MENTVEKDAAGKEIKPKYSFVETAFGVSEERFKELARNLIKDNVTQSKEGTRDMLMKKAIAECKTDGEKLSISNYEGFIYAMNSNPFYDGVSSLKEIGFTENEIDELAALSKKTREEQVS